MHPRADLVLRLSTPLIPDDHLTLRLNVPISTRIHEIAQHISNLHLGAVRDLKICLERFCEEEALPMGGRLMDCGVCGEGEYKLFYDFRPVTSPVLL
jgi:hypothetical protein